jgi:hypothetical protein
MRVDEIDCASSSANAEGRRCGATVPRMHRRALGASTLEYHACRSHDGGRCLRPRANLLSMHPSSPLVMVLNSARHIRSRINGLASVMQSVYDSQRLVESLHERLLEHLERLERFVVIWSIMNVYPSAHRLH